MPNKRTVAQELLELGNTRLLQPVLCRVVLDQRQDVLAQHLRVCITTAHSPKNKFNTRQLQFICIPSCKTKSYAHRLEAADEPVAQEVRGFRVHAGWSYMLKLLLLLPASTYVWWMDASVFRSFNRLC